jgi:hypothetical protein
MIEPFDTISEDLFGKKITLVGLAVDCKAAACLKLKNDIVVYIPNLDFWDETRFLGKEVYVTGVLQRKKIIPDPFVDENGAISTGAEGDQLILEKAKWKLKSNY